MKDPISRSYSGVSAEERGGEGGEGRGGRGEGVQVLTIVQSEPQTRPAVGKTTMTTFSAM